MTKHLPLFVIVASLSMVLACGRGDAPSGQPETAGAQANQAGGNPASHGQSGGAKASGDAALIQGTWETTRLTTAGKDLPLDAMAKGTTVTFEGDKMITRRYGEVQATWSFALDATKNPKQMTINRADAGQAEKLSFLIYKIEGDTLTTQSGGRDFPPAFSADTEQGCFLTTRRKLPDNAANLAMEDKLRFEVVSLEPRTGNRVRVTFKVANAAPLEIVRAKATIIVLDAAGAEIGSESHYVVKSGDGGLAPGASAEDDALITVSDPAQAASVRFKLESVRGG